MADKLKNIVNVGKFVKNGLGKSGKYYLHGLSHVVGHGLNDGVKNVHKHGQIVGCLKTLGAVTAGWVVWMLNKDDNTDKK